MRLKTLKKKRSGSRIGVTQISSSQPRPTNTPLAGNSHAKTAQLAKTNSESERSLRQGLKWHAVPLKLFSQTWLTRIQAYSIPLLEVRKVVEFAKTHRTFSSKAALICIKTVSLRNNHKRRITLLYNFLSTKAQSFTIIAKRNSRALIFSLLTTKKASSPRVSLLT